MIEQTNWFKVQSLYRYVRQRTEDKKVFKYVEVGATFALIAIFLITAIAPTASAISQLIGEINSKELTTKSMKQKIANIVSSQDSYAKIQEQYQILESAYPSKPEFYQAASIFSSASKQAGVSIDQLRYNLSGNNNSDAQKKYSYNIICSSNGSYSNFLSMIDNLTQNRRLIDIDSMTFSQVSNKINLNMSANLVYLPLD